MLLKDKSRLAWAEYGASDGIPVFYFHGTLGSRLEAEMANGIAHDLGVRLIAPERPGYGDSEQQNNFRFLDWPSVLVQLADHLDVNQFSVLGFSVGCNYALACAYSIPERVSTLSLVGALASYETEVMQNHISADFKPLYDLSLADEKATLQQLMQMAVSSDDLFNIIQSTLPPCDKALFEQDHIKTHYIKSIRLSIKHGVLGCMNDIYNLSRPWGFSLSNINLPIEIWHGKDDKNVGYKVGEYLASELKNITFYPQDNSGHYFIFDKWNDILEIIKQRSV